MNRLLMICFGPYDAEGGAGFAQALGVPFDLLSLSQCPAPDVGAATVLQANLADIPPADGLAEAMKPVCEGYSHIAAVSSMRSKDVLARLAGLVNAAMVSDAIGVESPTVFLRPVAAGSFVERLEALCEPIVLTVRPPNFPKPRLEPNGPTKDVSVCPSDRTVRISQAKRGGKRPDLTQAKVVVSGGRPLKDADTFERVIGGLADVLRGATGATRAAVDAGIAPNEMQVGQTGKIVAPDLYIAAGISGSTQHMAGVRDSKVIVAINKDPDAAVFEVADFGLVADLFDAVPALTQKLRS